MSIPQTKCDLLIKDGEYVQCKLQHDKSYVTTYIPSKFAVKGNNVILDKCYNEYFNIPPTEYIIEAVYENSRCFLSESDTPTKLTDSIQDKHNHILSRINQK